MQITEAMPSAIEAEQAVIGAIMVADSVAIADVADILPVYAFYREAHQKIYNAALKLFSEGTPIDLLSITEALTKSGDLEKVGGVAYLDNMIESVPTTSNAEYYAKLVLERHVRRQLLQLSVKLYNDCQDASTEVEDIITEAESAMLDIDEGKDSDSVSSLKSLLAPAMNYAQEAYNNSGGIVGLSTGFFDIDSLTSGLKKSNLVVVCGRPGMGKSVFLQNIAQHVAIDLQAPCFIHSAEMSKQEITLRMLASQAKVNSHALQNGFIAQDKWPAIIEASSVLSEAPVFIDDTPGLSPVQLFARCRRAKMQYGIQLILVDYIQLMEPPRRTSNRQEAVAEVSRGLKIMAKKLDVPVVVVSQLSRSPENRPNKRPKLSDLRESGAIEQDADLVLGLYREGYYDKSVKDNITEVEILKQRNGPEGIVNLLFDGQCVTFQNLEGRWRHSQLPSA